MARPYYQLKPIEVAKKIYPLRKGGMVARAIAKDYPELGITEASASTEVGRLLKILNLPDECLTLLEEASVDWTLLSKFLRETKINEMSRIMVEDIQKYFEITNVITFEHLKSINKTQEKSSSIVASIGGSAGSVSSLAEFQHKKSADNKLDDFNETLDNKPIQENGSLDKKVAQDTLDKGLTDFESLDSELIQPYTEVKTKVNHAEMLSSAEEPLTSLSSQHNKSTEKEQQKHRTVKSEALNQHDESTQKGQKEHHKSTDVFDVERSYLKYLRHKLDKYLWDELEGLGKGKLLQKIFSVILVGFSVEAVLSERFLTMAAMISVDLIFLYSWMSAKDFPMRIWARVISTVFVFMVASATPSVEIWNSYQKMVATEQGKKDDKNAVSPEAKRDRIAEAEKDLNYIQAQRKSFDTGKHLLQKNLDEYKIDLANYVADKKPNYPNPHLLKGYKNIDKSIADKKAEIKERKIQLRKEQDKAETELATARGLPVNTFSQSEVLAAKSQFNETLKSKGSSTGLRVLLIFFIIFLAIEVEHHKNDVNRRNKKTEPLGVRREV